MSFLNAFQNKENTEFSQKHWLSYILRTDYYFSQHQLYFNNKSQKIELLWHRKKKICQHARESNKRQVCIAASLINSVAGAVAMVTRHDATDYLLLIEPIRLPGESQTIVFSPWIKLNIWLEIYHSYAELSLTFDWEVISALLEELKHFNIWLQIYLCNRMQLCS